MNLEMQKTRLAALRQDYEVLRETLGVSVIRRVCAGSIDVGIVCLLAWILGDAGLSPWLSMIYVLIRDLPPHGRGVGKILTGVRVYAAATLSPASPRQLLVRGFVNLLVMIPLGFLLSVSILYVFMALVASGGIVGWLARDTMFLKWVGYDYRNGQTIADRFSGTHLILPGDVAALSRMADKIGRLEKDITAAGAASAVA